MSEIKLNMNNPVKTQTVVTVTYRKPTWPVGRKQQTTQPQTEIDWVKARLIRQGFEIMAESEPWQQRYIDL